MKMSELPIRNAASKYAEGSPARFHMPGHKGFCGELDVTELPGTDNLHSPHEAILRSEQLAAVSQWASDAFYIVNGSSAANLAMLFAVGAGKRILLGRNCHKSALNALAFAGQHAVPLFPDDGGVFSAEQIASALDREPCDAVFITSPTYRGAVSPIDEIARVCHERGALLLTDAAHGAHFAYSPQLPPIPKEADMWCVSCHKTLFAKTQTALLLLGKSCPLTRGEVQRVLNMFQSTSPSYELMLSIEHSVLEPLDWDAHIERLRGVRDRIEAVPGVKLLGKRGIKEQDFTRLNISHSGMTGYTLGAELEARGVFPEMADRECVTLITTPADPDEWYDRLIGALAALVPDGNICDTEAFDIEPLCGECVVTVREAVTGRREYIPIEEAGGHISAGAVGCYPPGVAILFPGEIIKHEAAERLLLERDAGAELFGLHDGLVPVLTEI